MYVFACHEKRHIIRSLLDIMETCTLVYVLGYSYQNQTTGSDLTLDWTTPNCCTGISRNLWNVFCPPFADNILGDTALVENLEKTKKTAAEIQQKVSEAKITTAKIDKARELYRPAATRASLLYFILNQLNSINPIYQFSLKVSFILDYPSFPLSPSEIEICVTLLLRALLTDLRNRFFEFMQAFSVVFHNAIEKSNVAANVDERVNNLIDCITYSVFIYTTRGLFEKDKLIFVSQMAFQVPKHDRVN